MITETSDIGTGCIITSWTRKNQMRNMRLVPSDKSDHTELSTMYLALRSDEQMDDILTDEQVSERMLDFISDTKFNALKIVDDTKTVGYVLVELNREPLYLKHLYVKPEFRRKGFGVFAIHQLLELLQKSEIDIEAMIWNENAVNFYKKLGFKVRTVGMRFRKE